MLPVHRIALCLPLAVALVASAAVGQAAAQSPSGDAKSQHTVVVWVEGGGKKDGEVREAITRSLPPSVKVVDEAAARR